MVEDNNIDEIEDFGEEVEEQSVSQTQTMNPILEDSNPRHLSGMFRNWFLEYASYVNLDRAIPHISDGLKPVQRRVLFAMRRLDDGRYNKVANIVGHTMQFHPHGDASIADALVNIGQKNVLVDCQGNWGNILTGDRAAASRYIEARLTPFALEAVFNPKTTDWKWSYDGRSKEPISLPVKFPLLLVHGTEGIGVGLRSSILPHNFGEVCDASIAYLKNEEFSLYPDFPTKGMIDVSKYNDGERGGKVTVRARIEKIDNKTLRIVEVPFGVTTSSSKDNEGGGLVESIIKANEKGKINIKKIDDNTSKDAEIIVYLSPQTSSDKAIDALYAFTKCQVNYSPQCCVVDDNTPQFTSISEVLRRSTDNTVVLLTKELEIEKDELTEKLHFSSLEKIFIEERIYKDKEFEQAKSTDAALDHIDLRLEPYKSKFVRAITREDLQKLLEIKMARILKFNKDKADELLAQLKKNIKDVQHKLDNIVDYAIDWFSSLKKKYAHLYPRLTEIRNFETINAVKVVEANEKLYINKAEGFIGYGLKKDENTEVLSACSTIDDVIVFLKDGKYKVVRIAEKLYVGKNIMHVAVYKKNDKRTIYNAVYRNGKNGDYYIKRFAVSSITREKENDLTQGTEGSKVIYFTANPNGEAETIKVALKQTTRRIKNLQFEKSFSDISIKGRQSMGNILTKFDIHKIILKQKGVSTLGGSDIWFDQDVLRLNSDSRGMYLGSFDKDEQIVVITKKGDYYTTSYELTNHFEDDILIIEKFDAHKIWTLVLYDQEQKFHYIKRFQMTSMQKRVSFMNGDQCRIEWISDKMKPIIIVHFGENDSFRPSLEIDAEEFIGVKGISAKGKRLSNFIVDRVEDITPIEEVQEELTEEETGDDDTSNENGSSIESQEEDVVTENVEVEAPAEPKKSAKKAKEKKVDKKEEDDDSDALDGVEIVSVNTLDNDDEKEPPVDEITGQMRLF